MGALLAARLARPLVDLDREIERQAGRSIPELFASEGEAGFRKREREALGPWPGSAPWSRSAAAAAQPGAAQRLLASGTLVYLRARVETLAARIGDVAGRPRSRASGPRRASRSCARSWRSASPPTCARASWWTPTTRRGCRRGPRGPAPRSGGDERGGTATSVEVALGERSYPIEIGLGTLDGLGAAVKRIVAPSRAFVIRRRRRPALGRADARLAEERAACACAASDVPDGERSKSLAQAARLYDALLAGARIAAPSSSRSAAAWWATSPRRRHAAARPAGRAGADQPARDGGFERRRQDGRQRRARQRSAPSTSRAWSGSTPPRWRRCRRASAAQASRRW